jgi:hypothetical protein
MSDKNELLRALYKFLARAHFERPSDEVTAARFGKQIEEAIAAPAQEVEPVAWMDDGSTGGFGQQKLRVITNETKLSMAHTLSSAYSIPLYLSPPTAELAAADMKRMCVEIVKKWRREHILEECCDRAQDVALSEVEKLIEFIPISDMGKEKP